MDKTKMIVRKFLIIAGLLMILSAVIAGILIIVFSFKFAGGQWISWWKYVLAMIGLGLGAMIEALTGIFTIYLAIDEGETK